MSQATQELHNVGFVASPFPTTEPTAAHWTPPLAAPRDRDLCTDCGISRTANPERCARACQFVKPDYAALEKRVHGRERNPQDDELFFGPYTAMYQAALIHERAGAQWTGITTRIAERLLETQAVDAVLTVAPDPQDSWRPVPVLVTDPAALRECRGMRMGYAPLLALLEPALAQGYTRLAVIAVPCQVHALRVLEPELGFERLEVIGIPCSDNTTTAHFHHFLSLLDPHPEQITYLEFRADYQVELRFTNGQKRTIPFLQLPLSTLSPHFFPLPCKTCVDYTNSLADITVGYMGGRGEQWLLVRNAKGQALLQRVDGELRKKDPSSEGKRHAAVRGFIQNTQRAAGGLPLRSTPKWIRPLVAWLMPKIGPKGLEFARARVEMKAAESVLHLRRARPNRIAQMIPPHLWTILKPYPIEANPSESHKIALD